MKPTKTLFILSICTLTFLISSLSVAADWKINKEMKFNLAFLPPKNAETQKTSSKALLKNIPRYRPDIENILYKNLLIIL